MQNFSRGAVHTGKLFCDFCCSNRWHILKHGTKPTFRRINCKTLIDIGAFNAKFLPYFTGWQAKYSDTHFEDSLITTNIDDTRYYLSITPVSMRFVSLKLKI